MGILRNSQIFAVIGLTIIIIFLSQGCYQKQHWGTFKTVGMEVPPGKTEIGPQVYGRDCVFCLLFFDPSLRRAVDNALKDCPEAVGLKNVQVTEIYLLNGTEPRCIEITGIPVK